MKKQDTRTLKGQIRKAIRQSTKGEKVAFPYLLSKEQQKRRDIEGPMGRKKKKKRKKTGRSDAAQRALRNQYGGGGGALGQ